MSKTSPRTKPLVERLRDAIRQAERRGITQYRIAADAGIHQSQLARLMGGTVAPKLDTAEKIARAVGCRIEILRDDT
jgi:predicted transcriptional regulator